MEDWISPVFAVLGGCAKPTFPMPGLAPRSPPTFPVECFVNMTGGPAEISAAAIISLLINTSFYTMGVLIYCRKTVGDPPVTSLAFYSPIVALCRFWAGCRAYCANGGTGSCRADSLPADRRQSLLIVLAALAQQPWSLTRPIASAAKVLLPLAGPE
ncbi:hypothetical protein KM043_017532 [Ampulex compressa]|nr:hypothetical protein KM043_017532 [Ampulex compressa]